MKRTAMLPKSAEPLRIKLSLKRTSPSQWANESWPVLARHTANAHVGPGGFNNKRHGKPNPANCFFADPIKFLIDSGFDDAIWLKADDSRAEVDEGSDA